MSETLAVSGPAVPVFLGAPALVPVRLCGREGLNSLFEYELLLQTPDALNLGASGTANFNLDDFIGREVSCSIQLDGAGQFIAGVVGASIDHIGAGVRQINALVADAACLGEEGRHIRYRLTLRPWLHLATLTTDCKVFQNKTVVDNLPRYGGGGSLSCCVLLAPKWTPELKATVRWTIGHYTEPWSKRKHMMQDEENACCWAERTLTKAVPIESYGEDGGRLQVFFLPNDEIAVAANIRTIGACARHPWRRCSKSPRLQAPWGLAIAR